MRKLNHMRPAWGDPPVIMAISPISPVSSSALGALVARYGSSPE
jgi:hypothetical protein